MSIYVYIYNNKFWYNQYTNTIYINQALKHQDASIVCMYVPSKKIVSMCVYTHTYIHTHINFYMLVATLQQNCNRLITVREIVINLARVKLVR